MKDLQRLSGNIAGLRSQQLRAFERLARRRVPPELVVSPELARDLTAISVDTGRQVGLLIDRGGQVQSVIAGDAHQIILPFLGSFRGAAGRLKGLRCVHTHLAGEGLSDDDLMDLVFLRLDMMAALTIGKDGLPRHLHVAHINPGSTEVGKAWDILPPQLPGAQNADCLQSILALEEELVRLHPAAGGTQGKDRAILIGVTTARSARDMDEARRSMDELVELARSADCQVLSTVVQRLRQLHPKWLMGKGKLAEIMLTALRQEANLLVFDQELNPSQVRSITDHTELRVVDRTQLILDIFARRARSREGKLQVEMAQLKYMLPRLGQRDDALSRLTGGIGGRGPGETRLEIDRRRIKDRLSRLEDRLREVEKERQGRRSRRRKNALPVLSIIGYTNAGKSTLLNRLTKSDILAEDKLFATLDPTSRRLRFPRDTEVIVTDTVGFIRHLPAELLKAFRATLEELAEADLLIHVVDVSNPRFEQQMETVEKIVRELELDDIPCLLVFNKIDQVDRDYAIRQAERYEAIAVSAFDPATFPPLLEKAEAIMLRQLTPGPAATAPRAS